jgi:CheY-like chemotaxis protein
MARILLADDDAASRDLVRRALESDGHSVEATEDGAEALERIEGGAGRFDLLVTDIQMPAIDGFQLAERALAIKGDLRIVLMSGYADAFKRTAQLPAERLGTLTKPFTLEQIRAVVRQTLA